MSAEAAGKGWQVRSQGAQEAGGWCPSRYCVAQWPYACAERRGERSGGVGAGQGVAEDRTGKPCKISFADGEEGGDDGVGGGGSLWQQAGKREGVGMHKA